jgi:hypothetical protein
VALFDLTVDRAQRSSDGDPDGGWAELMTLAANFPLELLSFGNSPAAPVVLPKPRSVSYDDVIDIVDGAGLSLATW